MDRRISAQDRRERESRERSPTQIAFAAPGLRKRSQPSGRDSVLDDVPVPPETQITELSERGIAIPSRSTSQCVSTISGEKGHAGCCCQDSQLLEPSPSPPEYELVRVPAEAQDSQLLEQPSYSPQLNVRPQLIRKFRSTAEKNHGPA